MSFVLSVYFVIDSVWKLLVTPSYEQSYKHFEKLQPTVT